MKTTAKYWYERVQQAKFNNQSSLVLSPEEYSDLKDFYADGLTLKVVPLPPMIILGFPVEVYYI